MSKALYPKTPIMLVDDEEQFLMSAELTLFTNGINNICKISDSRRVMTELASKTFSLIVLDIDMPNITGIELLPKIVDKHPEIPVVIITAINDVEDAVFCIQNGAFNYLLKPVDETRFVTTVKSGLDLREIRTENQMLKKYLLADKLQFPEAFEHIITKSNEMRGIFKYIEAIGRTHLPVLVNGETGVGKELIAAAIHQVSGRTGNLVTVNVAGVDDTLFSDTLFGHKKGAFTGAEIERNGLIEQAQGGTLFLDEIGDLSIESQVKLLRLLQDGHYYPLGSDLPKYSDSRIICATHRDLASMKDTNEFRADLFYRLQSHQIIIPPLRERKEDIPMLVDFFISKAASELGKKPPALPKQIYTLLSNYNFPGNIRELGGLIYNAVSLHIAGTLSLDTIKQKIFSGGILESEYLKNSQIVNDNKLRFPEILPGLKEMETLLINEALKRADGNQTIAAELLGMSRRALNNRLQRNKDN